jgi:hypothetical protein
MKCLKNLSISQLVKLSQRYQLKPQYKNPRKRGAALRRCLRNYWKTHPIEDCAICWEPIQPKHLCITPCAHLFCNKCLLPYVRQSEKCPLCRAACPYTYLLNKIYKIPEIVAYLKSLLQAHAPTVEDEPVEEEQMIYHINVYIIIQRGVEDIRAFFTVFLAIFFVYYYYLLIVKSGLQFIYLCMNLFTIGYLVYYLLHLITFQMPTLWVGIFNIQP